MMASPVRSEDNGYGWTPVFQALDFALSHTSSTSKPEACRRIHS